MNTAESPASNIPRWIEAYPRAVESLNGFFAEWETEREELQACCASLAFQVFLAIPLLSAACFNPERQPPHRCRP
jgi:hypothetical protein